jgi:ribonucleoside-triphosphate reductase
MGVVTINLPRLAFKFQDDIDGFYEELTSLVKICGRINHVKRRLVQKRIDNGNHPLYTLGFIDINTQYSTVGINGFYGI